MKVNNIKNVFLAAIGIGALATVATIEEPKSITEKVEIIENPLGATKEQQIASLKEIVPDYYSDALYDDSIANETIQELNKKAAMGAYVYPEEQEIAEYEKECLEKKINFLSKLENAINSLDKTKPNSKERQIADSIIDDGIDKYFDHYIKNYYYHRK